MEEDKKIMKMKNIYYSARGYWKGMSAINKLATEAGVGYQEAKNFLLNQQLWQIYLPAPPDFPRPHFTVRKPNQVHQADLLFLPRDTIKRMVYKYALVVVDIASRYTDAEALPSKESRILSIAFNKIYKRKLKWPDTLMVDPGKEFMGMVSVLMKKNNVVIQRSEAGNHITQAFVERANRTVGEKIFSHQYAQELISGGTARKWVGQLRGILNSMNNTHSKVISSTPVDAIRMTGPVKLVQKTYERPVGMNEERLPAVVNVRYLYRAGESEGGEKKRATDAVWSLKIYTLLKTIIEPDQPVLYFLTAGPKRGFVREQLQVVPANSQLPPNSVLKK